MTGVFRSCLPRFYSTTPPSISDEYLSQKTNSMECLSIISHQNITTNPQLNSPSYHEKQSNHIDVLPSSPKQISPLKTTKKRGPRYSRIHEKSQPLLTRVIGTIFGDYGSTIHKKPRPKKSLLPSKSTIKKQFEENEQTLRSLVTLLTQIESNVQTTSKNNNRIDDRSVSSSFSNILKKLIFSSSSHSTDTYHPPSKIYTKKRQSENDTLSSRSRRKMVDNQQQTQFYPTKINIGTSTQLNDPITSELSWFDMMREDPTTINAWARIRRRLKPNQQKDILRYRSISQK